ncbi:RimJ/RimL family protein N-acetyltransferase [Actinokineospora baliensis]|uniref:GNAT family N-acetyltransferase n=1 Tax=Actinokineospora baliensis TaxID=547056 RepID=UPI00195DF56B|nr:GNAT family N-acetyltransferase [Actinokineospora baliensis]MBM7772043.1 RimJ/RimL family protein N-acetyltransferase [Actinokineospora baliensis]
MAISRATPADWSAIRAVRLAALTEAPYAFASTLAKETPYGDDHWRDWPRKHAVFLAFADVEPVAIAAGIPGDPVEMISVWIAPAARGTSLATELVETLVDWAKAEGAGAVNAWVVGNNPRARRFYDRLGFTPNGREMPYPNDPSITEYHLTRPV